jgi:lysophospholipid acyltransferase
MSLIDESMFKSNNANGNVPGGTKSGRKVPKGRKRVAYRKMILGLLFLGLFVTLGGSFNYGVAIQPWFAARSILYRYVFVPG